MAALERQVFSTPRGAEFLERRALQSQAGRPADEFGDVVVKELVDNACDACETAGVQPVVEVDFELAGEVQRIVVARVDRAKVKAQVRRKIQELIEEVTG